MSPLIGWTAVVVLLVAPLIHVAVSPRGGPFRPPEGARCPLGPRVGWLVYMARRRGAANNVSKEVRHGGVRDG